MHGQPAAVHAAPEFENTRIIIVSGVIKQDEIDQLLKSGAEDFVRKPFDISELMQKVSATLQMVAEVPARL